MTSFFPPDFQNFFHLVASFLTVKWHGASSAPFPQAMCNTPSFQKAFFSLGTVFEELSRF